MPWIAEVIPYNAVLEKVDRLALWGVLDEVGRIVTGFDLRVLERTNANGAAVVRRMLDARFKDAGWLREERGRGDIDWIKRIRINGVTVATGIELQVSGRGGGSHLSDIMHLRAGIAEPDDGRIDVGLLVVPTDQLARYLTDRVEGVTQVRKYLRSMSAENLPILLVAIAHDGPGPALPKQEKRQSGAPPRSGRLRTASSPPDQPD